MPKKPAAKAKKNKKPTLLSRALALLIGGDAKRPQSSSNAGADKLLGQLEDEERVRNSG